MNEIIYKREKALPDMQESARLWYRQHRQGAAQIHHDMFTAEWAKSYSFKTSGNNITLVVPLANPHVTKRNKHISLNRFLVFQTSEGNITDGKIIELLGKKYNVKKHSDYLLQNISQNSIPGFTGAILQYNVNYQPVANAVYEKGNKKSNTHTSIVKFSGKDKSPVRFGVGALPVYALKPGRYKINDHIYTVKGMIPYKTILIEDNDSLVSDFLRHAAAHSGGLKINPFSQETLSHVFKKVLGDARLKELSESEKGNIIVTLYCAAKEGKGKIAAVEFRIFNPQENKLKLNEIDKVSDYIKTNIVFDIPSSPNNQNKIWPVAQAINFSRLVN